MNNFKDRTSEFYNLVDRIKKRGKVHVPTNKKPTSTSSRSEFARMAAQLGRSIGSTSEKLEQLTTLTKSGISNQTEINTLTQSIRQDINKLNTQIKILQSVSKSKASTKQSSEHSNSVIMLLQTKLADTSLGFKQVLESEVDIQHQHQQQIQPASPQPRRRVNANQNMQEETYESPQSLGIPMISQQVMIEQQDQRIEQRSNAMETIESTIAELGGIFSQLATMVAEQRETIQRIDQNTDDIEMNVIGAQNQLMKYYSNISSNRSFIIKVFITVIFFFLLFSMF
ncbi:t-SNARE [Pilaira anomala]|nr:t-SNARE [Pilaira anomala]